MSNAPAISYGSISPHLERIAAGGEGIVFRVQSQTDVIYKEYKPAQLASVNIPALNGLIDFAAKLSDAERSYLYSRSVWPTHLVADGNQVRGFLMRAIPQRHYRRHGLAQNPKNVLLDWNQLIYSEEVLPPHMLSEVPRLDSPQITELLTDLATTMNLLHRHGIVIGDISGKNLIWSVSPHQVLLIDCDSFRFAGTRGVCDHKESPGWIDPTLAGGPTSQESDIFKLGVAAYRALWQDGNSVATGQLSRSGRSDIPTALVELIQRSLETPPRPTAAEWLSELGGAYRFGGRPALKTGSAVVADQPKPQQSSAASVPSGSSRPPRPRLRVEGPSR